MDSFVHFPCDSFLPCESVTLSYVMEFLARINLQTAGPNLSGNVLLILGLMTNTSC